MKSKHLAVLVVILIVLGGLAYYRSRTTQRQRVPPSQIGKPVLPDLAVNDVEKITFFKTGETVTVAKVSGRWVAPTKYNYPVKFDKVTETLRSLADLKVGQVIRAGEDARAALQLKSPLAVGTNETDAAGQLVEFCGASGSALASLLIGKTREKEVPAAQRSPMYASTYPDGRYLAVGESVYLVAETLSSLPDELDDWFDDKLVGVYAQDLNEVTVTGTGREPIRLKRPEGGGDFVLEGMTEEQEKTSKVNDMVGALASLRFRDVADPALDDAALGMNEPVTYTASAKNGQTYTLTVGGKTEEDGEDRYVRLRVAYEPPPEPPEKETAEKEETEDAGTPDEEAQKKKEEEAKKKAEEQVKLAAETRTLNSRVEPWTYVIASYDVDDMLYERSELVKDKEKEEEKEKEKDEAAEKQEEGAAAEAEKTEGGEAAVEGGEAVEQREAQPGAATPESGPAAEPAAAAPETVPPAVVTGTPPAGEAIVSEPVAVHPAPAAPATAPAPATPAPDKDGSDEPGEIEADTGPATPVPAAAQQDAARPPATPDKTPSPSPGSDVKDAEVN